MTSLPQPERLWEIRVHDVRSSQGLSGLCVGYEQGQWRYSAFANYIMEWLPEFCLNTKERKGLSHATAVKSLRKAANLVYQTDKYRRRGEFGELFLHAAIRSVFESLPAISKIFYKSAHNDTVKGFDCVHIVGHLDNLELWLGEVKFYADVATAMRDVIAELRKHLAPDFLRNEFILIGNKLDNRDAYTQAVQRLLSERTSLDDIFKRICIPVMLTYESTAVAAHTTICQEYITAFENEVKQHHATFTQRSAGLPMTRCHLFLLPLEKKQRLVNAMHDKLKAMQGI